MEHGSDTFLRNIHICLCFLHPGYILLKCFSRPCLFLVAFIRSLCLLLLLLLRTAPGGVGGCLPASSVAKPPLRIVLPYPGILTCTHFWYHLQCYCLAVDSPALPISGRAAAPERKVPATPGREEDEEDGILLFRKAHCKLGWDI